MHDVVLHLSSDEHYLERINKHYKKMGVKPTKD
jgi:hypothetical protein